MNFFKFLQEVRSETEKVTWPTRRETAITTAMVFVMVALTAIFFLIADQIMRVVVTFILDIADWRANLAAMSPVSMLIFGGVIGLVAFFIWSLNRNRGR